MVQASTMKWMDLSLNGTGCHWGIYSRDGNFLRSFPRTTDHVVMGSANRCTILCLQLCSTSHKHRQRTFQPFTAYRFA